MPRVTFTATPLVWIEVLGEKPDPGQANRNDAGLVSDLLNWLDGNGIRHVGCGMNSPGRMSFNFLPTDALRVLAWLKTHGAKDTATAGTGET